MVTVYISAYADLPMGLLFGAPLALYFSQEEKTPAVLWTCVMGVAFVSITKDTGFALALVGGGHFVLRHYFCAGKKQRAPYEKGGRPGRKMDVFGLPCAGAAYHIFWLGPAHGHDAGRQPLEPGRRQEHEPGAAFAHRPWRAVRHWAHRAVLPRDGRDVAGLLFHKAHHVQCG